MKKNITVFVGALIALLCLHTTSKAQEREGEVSVSITKEVNGEKTVFEKTYASLEEMKADEKYQEFSDNSGFTWSTVVDELEKEVTVRIITDEEGDVNIETEGNEDVIIMSLDGQSGDEINTSVKIKQIVTDGDEPSITRIRKIIEEIDSEEMVIVSSVDDEFSVIISEPQRADFGKSGIVSASDRFSSEDLDIDAIGNHLLVKFPLAETRDVSVSLEDDKGESLFLSKIPGGKDKIKQIIDLSHYKAGDYLLTLEVGKKKLTKKITITKPE